MEEKEEKNQKKEQKNKKEKEQKNYKRILKKVFLGIIVIIVALAILFLLNFIRNIIIINDIIEKESKFKDSTNYSYSSSHHSENNEDDKITIDIYYKDGKSKMILDNGKNEIRVWYDEDTKENIFIAEDAKKASVTTSEFVLGNEVIYFYDEENKITYALTSFIVNSKLDGKECYKVTHSNEEIYINKEDGTILKDIDKDVKVDGKKSKTITEYSNWKFDELTDEEMQKPDLTGYTIVNN